MVEEHIKLLSCTEIKFKQFLSIIFITLYNTKPRNQALPYYGVNYLTIICLETKLLSLCKPHASRE
jgi:hypothetical protein